MAGGPLIPDKVEKLIVKVHLKHPNWRAKQIRAEVESMWRENHPGCKPGWPGLSAVQKKLTITRKNEGKTDKTGLERPWCIGTLAIHEVPPEAVPIILEIQKRRLENKGAPLTIREAKWVARLHRSIAAEQLEGYAMLYALTERAYELSRDPDDPNPPIDTLDIDEAVMVKFDYTLPGLKWLLTSSVFSKTGQKQIGAELAQMMESTLGLTLKTPKFTGKGSWMYFFLLQGLIGLTSGLTKEKLHEVIARLRNWVRENEPEFKDGLPKGILADIIPSSEFLKKIREDNLGGTA